MVDRFNNFIEELANTKVTSNVYNQYSYEAQGGKNQFVDGLGKVKERLDREAY